MSKTRENVNGMRDMGKWNVDSLNAGCNDKKMKIGVLFVGAREGSILSPAYSEELLCVCVCTYPREEKSI